MVLLSQVRPGLAAAKLPGYLSLGKLVVSRSARSRSRGGGHRWRGEREALDNALDAVQLSQGRIVESRLVSFG